MKRHDRIITMFKVLHEERARMELGEGRERHGEIGRNRERQGEGHHGSRARVNNLATDVIIKAMDTHQGRSIQCNIL
jgi:hypothetical protein